MAAQPRLQHRFEDVGAALALAAFRMRDLDRASAMGGRLARAIGPRLKRVHARIDANLRLAMPELDPAQRAAISRGVWDNLGRVLGELAHYDALRAGFRDGRVTVRGQEVFDRVRSAGRPHIFVSGHMANWEVMQLSLINAGLDGVTVYRAANNPLVDRRIVSLRKSYGDWDLAPKGREGARLLIKALKQGRHVCMLCDQKMNDGITAPFFGVPAMTAPAAAELSLRFDAPIVPGSIVRTGGAHFEVTVHEPWAVRPTQDRRADVLALTSRINDHLETVIRAHPGQWLWLHRRWPKDAKALA